MEKHKTPKIREYSWLGTPQCAQAWQKLAPLTGVDKDTLGKFQYFVFGPELTGFKEEEFSKKTHDAFVKIAGTVGEKSHEYRKIRGEIERGLIHGWLAVRAGESLENEFTRSEVDQIAKADAFKDIFEIPRAKLLQHCLWDLDLPVVRRMCMKEKLYRGLEEEDFLAEIHRIFIRAMRNYDPEEGAAFFTYYMNGIRLEHRNLHRDNNWGRHLVLESQMPKSTRDEDGESFLARAPAEDRRMEFPLTSEELKRLLAVVVEECKPRKRKEIERGIAILYERAKDKTLKEIGDEMGVSRSRVGQIEAFVLKKLREAAAKMLGEGEGTAP